MLSNKDIQKSVKTSNDFFQYCDYWIEHFINHNNSHCNYNEFIQRTSRATAPLISVQELLFYTIAYGAQHFCSNYQFITDSICMTNDTRLRVIDYGCGQGIASLALMQYLYDNELTGVELELHLIEPSALSLQTAIWLIEHFAERMGLRVSIHAQNCYLHDFEVPENQDIVDNLHLLSNVADIYSVQQLFAPLAAALANMQGTNLLLSNAPSYVDAWHGSAELCRKFSYANCIEHSDNYVRVPRYDLRHGCVRNIEVCQRQVFLEWQA